MSNQLLKDYLINDSQLNPVRNGQFQASADRLVDNSESCNVNSPT